MTDASLTSGRALTIGIDFAAQRAETGRLRRRLGRAARRDRPPTCGLDDDEIVALLDAFAPENVAIDAPFGWPRAFVAAVAAYETTGDWPIDDVSPLRLRDTDRFVIDQTRQQPLSVSSDRIAVTAMRCARLLTRLRRAGFAISRDGVGLVAEVYPAAALRIWGVRPARLQEQQARGTGEAARTGRARPRRVRRLARSLRRRSPAAYRERPQLRRVHLRDARTAHPPRFVAPDPV